MEKSTSELMEILKSKKTYKDFLNEEIEELCFSSISEYLEMLLVEKKLKKSDVINKSNLDKNYAYQIFNGNKTNPSRDKIIMLAFGMQLSLGETRKLLKICSLNDLYIRNPRDSVIIYCLYNSLPLMAANEYLDDLSLKILE
ncbi:MAG: hypothetical protein LUH82_08015 [Clostridiales bacterium]|nr:hypothetical protein [Clostridiales bacterium]